jgi:hypothetical protein
LRIAYKVNNSVQHLLDFKTSTEREDKFRRTGIYQSTCPDCGKTYRGQTGKTSRKDTKNTYIHLEIIITQNFPKPFGKWPFLRKDHDVIEILHFSKKGVHTDTIARLYISKETAKGNQLKDIQFPVIKFSKPDFHASSQYPSL